MKQYRLNALQIAEAIHNITSRIPRLDGSLVDLWCDLNDTQKERAAKVVREIYSCTKKTPKELHDVWAEPLLTDGWTSGEYNRENKQHPCLVPFENLPDSEILKDEIWGALTEVFRDYYDDDSDNQDWV